MFIDNKAETSYMTWKYEGKKTPEGKDNEPIVPDSEIKSITANPTRIMTPTKAQEIQAEFSLANKKRLEAFGSSRGFLPKNDVYTGVSGVSVVTLTARTTRQALVHA